MNYLAKASVVASRAPARAARSLEHLKGLTVPVRISGPFESLSYKTGTGRPGGGRGKSQGRGKEGGDQGQGRRDQVKDKLKGLFGK
jgi:AsmA protein